MMAPGTPPPVPPPAAPERTDAPGPRPGVLAGEPSEADAGPAPTADDRLWRALADPTRRAILDLLREGPLPAHAVAAPFAISRFGVRKHLRVLERAGLVLVEERGRERWHHLNPVPIRAIAHRWLRPFEAAAADHLLSIRRLAEGREEERRP